MYDAQWRANHPADVAPSIQTQNLRSGRDDDRDSIDSEESDASNETIADEDLTNDSLLDDMDDDFFFCDPPATTVVDAPLTNDDIMDYNFSPESAYNSNNDFGTFEPENMQDIYIDVAQPRASGPTVLPPLLDFYIDASAPETVIRAADDTSEDISEETDEQYAESVSKQHVKLTMQTDNDIDMEDTPTYSVLKEDPDDKQWYCPANCIENHARYTNKPTLVSHI